MGCNVNFKAVDKKIRTVSGLSQVSFFQLQCLSEAKITSCRCSFMAYQAFGKEANMHILPNCQIIPDESKIVK